jgi:hypothetical protein
VGVVEEAAATIARAEAGMPAYVQAYGHALSRLVILERYERRAESQFLSASRQYAQAESAVRGVSLVKA